MQTKLPDLLRIVMVGEGFVLVRAEGLYEAKLTVAPILEVPKAPSIYGPSASVGGKAAEGAGPSKGAVTGNGDENGDDDDDDVTSGPKPKRWLWLMLSFELLPNSCLRQPLAEPQMLHLLQDLNMRMSLATDSAAYEKLRTARAAKLAAAGASANANVDAMDVDQEGPSQPVHSAVMPSASAVASGGGRRGAGSRPTTSAAATTATTNSGITGTVAMSCRAQLRSNLEELKRFAADEATLPLLTAHFILCEVSTR